MAPRTLTLRAERLAELTGAELAAVAGGDSYVCIALTQLCPTQGCTGHYPTIAGPCDR